MENVLIGLLLICSAGYLVYFLRKPFKQKNNCGDGCNCSCDSCHPAEKTAARKIKDTDK